MKSSKILALAVVSATAAACSAGAPIASANAVPNWDRHFLLESAEGAHFEIDMGKIAVRNGRTKEARADGALMVRDHSGELHALKALAARLHVRLPNHPSVLQRHEISGVTSHTGAAFDRAYARLEVGDHIGDVQSADGELAEGGLAQVKASAATFRVMYRRHLAAFRKLAHDVHAT
jgi:putative membrane protein